MLQQPQPQRKDENVNNLDNFQSKSRLHFIGSWINEASGMIRKILDQNPEYDHSSFFGEQNIVCHVDMDCFFVLVALSKPENAHLRDKPVAVASGGNYSEISSCSYKAREYGVRASMWLHEAKKICPELQLVKYDFDRVRAINEMIYKSAFELCPNGTHMKLQVISVDEFFVAFDTKNFELARRFCEDLREKIFRESNGCTASCGIAPNVHVARAVTDLAKPNGIKLVSDDECLKFVREMQVDSIHGVGRKMQEKIKNMLVIEKIEPTGIPKKKKKVQPPQQLPQRRKREEDEDDDDDDIPLLNDDEETENDQPQMMMMNNNNNNEEESNNKERVIVIRDLLPLSLSKLKHYLGQAMAEKLHNLAHKALDHTLVVGTGTSDSGAIPKAVGTTMNYAVRLNQLHEFSGLLLQLCKDIESKLERVGGAALIVKLTVLVRHPEASVQTKKHLGCGWCDEYVLGQAKAISSEVAFTKAEKIHDTLLPFAMKVIYVDHRSEGKKDQDEDQNDGEELESKEKINTWRPAQRFVVTNENINSHNILITDLRGITLNASSIIPKVKSKTGINEKKIQQQISIADSFRKQQQKNQQQKHQEDENKNIFISDDEVHNFAEGGEDCDDDDDELKVVSSSRRKKNSQNDDGVIVLCSQDGDAAARKKNNKASSSAAATVAVSSQDDLDDEDEILVMTESPNKHNKTKNKNHQLMSSSTYTVISSQENEDDDILVSDSRDGAPSASSNSKNASRDKNPHSKKHVTFNEKSKTTSTTVASTDAKSKIMAQAKELVDKNFFFSRENPLCMMSVILVAAKNGKIMNILASKDPKNEDFRKQAAEFVLREGSSNSDASSLGMKLIGANNNKKGNCFTEEEIAMAKRILQ